MEGHSRTIAGAPKPLSSATSWPSSDTTSAASRQPDAGAVSDSDAEDALSTGGCLFGIVPCQDYVKRYGVEYEQPSYCEF